jgi:hypothetical protein
LWRDYHTPGLGRDTILNGTLEYLLKVRVTKVLCEVLVECRAVAGEGGSVCS